jgi:hypothetical protein
MVAPMKIVTDTPDRLVLGDRPLAVGIMLVATILLLAAAGLATLFSGNWPAGLMLLAGAGAFYVPFAVFVVQTVAVFDRPTGTGVLRRKSVRRQTEDSFPLTAIRIARLDRRERRENNGRRTVRLARIALHLADGRTLHLPEAHVGGPAVPAAADALRRWLGLDSGTGTA